MRSDWVGGKNKQGGQKVLYKFPVSEMVDGADIDLGKVDKSELVVFSLLFAVSREEFATASGASPPLASGFWLKPRFL